MKTIRNTKLFNELKKNSSWETLFDGIDIKDSEIPVFAGGLDHIDVKTGGIYFHDIGCNNRENSFVIRKEI
jgi:hypothetical protein